MTTQLEELNRMNLGDHRVRSISWSESGDDFSINLVGPGSPTRQVTLTFVWTTELAMKMCFGTYSGLPLVSDVSFAPRSSATGYIVRVEFGAAPEGVIELVCDQVRVEQGKMGP